MMRRFGVVLAVLMLTAGCGSDSTGPTGGGSLNNGTFRARVDGADFNAVAATVITTPVGTGGTIIAIGAGAANNTAIGFAWIDNGPGTYVINQAVGANANYNEAGGGAWTAPLASQGSGSIVVTSRTANRVVGTFSFVLVPVAGGASGNRTISAGSFDLTF